MTWETALRSVGDRKDTYASLRDAARNRARKSARRAPTVAAAGPFSRC